MTEEEKKAIEQYKNIQFETYDYTCMNCVFEDKERKNCCSDCCENNKNIILNLIQKQDTEIKKLNNVIDMLIEEIKYGAQMYCHKRDDCEVVGGNRTCEDCIKKYFMKDG